MEISYLVVRVNANFKTTIYIHIYKYFSVPKDVLYYTEVYVYFVNINNNTDI